MTNADEDEYGTELVGAWKMVSCTAEVEGESEPRYPLGKNPNGYVVITANHRIMALITTGDPRKPATNDAEFTFKPEGDQTAVTWSLAGNNNFISKAVCLFVDMDKMVGGDFEKGLTALKTQVESRTRKS